MAVNNLNNNLNNNIDEFYMRRALELAKRGAGFTSPNPLVGCVIVKDNEIIGEGWHEKFGEAHAEINALNDAARRGHSAAGSTLYVTLEPCCHLNKKTPPCAQRLVKENIARVVAAMSDPNPNVNNKGFDILREAGIEVTCGCLENEARWLNRGFIKAQEAKRPWVSLKAACSLDGCMALANGESKWITGLEARTQAHAMRANHDAVLVGIGTVLADNPELNVRLVDCKREPLRVILDSHLRTPVNSKIINSGKEANRCVIFYCDICDDAKLRAENLIQAGAELILVDDMNLQQILKILLERKGVLKLMSEGGPHVLTSFMRENLADSLSLFIAPKIIGRGLGLGEGINLNSMREAFNLKNIKTQNFSNGDILLEGVF